MIFNRIQSSLEFAEAYVGDLLKKSEFDSTYIKEALGDILELVDSIQYIKNVTALDRPTLQTVDKDESGKIIVDTINPHVLEDMDYFRPAALHFEKHGVYTSLYRNGNPNSAYMQYWKEERRRCMEGYVRESDGEWIPGYYYFYLNYSPIILTNKYEEDGVIRTKREYEFARVWDGDYAYFHYIDQAENENKYGNVLKTRRRGYSYKAGALLTRNFYFYPRSRSYAFASDKQYLTGDGILTKTWDVLDWVDSNTPWRKLRGKKDTEMHKRASYVDSETGAEMGYKSEIMGITMKNNPDAARGKAGKLVMIEESGVFPNLKKVWSTTRMSLEDGSLTFGLMVAFGTGGSEGANFEAAEEFFYYPDGYNIKGFPNVFDKNAMQSKCSFWVPEYQNRDGCYDDNGNSDVIKALCEIITARLVIKYGSSDPRVLTQEKADRAITPQEAVMRTEGTMFPVADLKDYMTEIAPNMQSFLSSNFVGRLKPSGINSVQWIPDADAHVIREFPLKNTLHQEGAVEIFTKPVKSSSGQVMRGRYIGGCLTPGEKVMTDSGLQNVEFINKEDKLINKDGKLVDIKELLRYDVINEPTFNLKVGNTYRTTNFTGEHPILVSDVKWKYHEAKYAKVNNLPYSYKTFDFKFKEARDIKEGQWIKVPNIYKKEKAIDSDLWNKYKVRIDRSINAPFEDSQFWWFIGLYLGDGWVTKSIKGHHTINVVFNTNEESSIARFKFIVDYLFDRKPSSRIRENAIEFKFTDEQLGKFLLDNFGKYAHGKVIPEWIKYLNHKHKIELVSGYLNSDGYIGYNKKTKKYASEFVSVSLELVEGIQDILYSIGIISTTSLLRKASKHLIRNRWYNTRETYRVRLSHYDTIHLGRLIGRGVNAKVDRIDEDVFYSFNERRFSVDVEFSENQEYIYTKIKNIETDLYTGIIYNFECETNTFMCRNITTHNCDPVDSDAGTSLASTFIFDLFTDKIVAEFTGRPDTANAFYETSMRLAIYYSATINYENNLKGMFAYFSNKQMLHLLCPTPSILKDMDYIKGNNMFGNKALGTPANKAINSWARKLLADWMIGKAYEDSEDYRINLQTIKSIGLIKEAIAWHPDLNADRVSAMGMVMIYRYEMLNRIDAMRNFDDSTPTLAQDPFFTNNYDNRSFLDNDNYKENEDDNL